MFITQRKIGINNMKLKLDTIITFALIIPFIMTYRIGPGETPYWLFGLIFLAIGISIILDIGIFSIHQKLYSILKLGLLWFLIFSTIGASMFSQILVRHQTSPIYQVHDIIVQQEAAIRFTLHGTNPYAATYFNTPMKDWPYSPTEVNPALYHFVMEPFYLIFAIPFYLVMGHTIGFFDARVPLFFLFIALLLLVQKLVKEEDTKRLFLSLMAFNPAMLGYFIEGRDDVFMYVFCFAGFFALHKNKDKLSAILFAIAFATKQSIWPLFPLYIAYLFFKYKNIKRTFLVVIPFALTFGIIVAPFFLWNPYAFLDSTIFYLSGNSAHSYPIAGYGLGALLHQIGIIKDVHGQYPFGIWQLCFALPALIGLIFWLRKNNSVQRLIISYGLFLFIFWYMSRYFNNSHLGYLTMVFITAYFWPEKTEVI